MLIILISVFIKINDTQTGTNDPIPNLLRYVYRKIILNIVDSSFSSILDI